MAISKIIEEGRNIHKLYFKPFFEYLEGRIETAKSIENKDPEMSILMCLVSIEGLAKIRYPNYKKGERFKKFLAEYCKIRPFTERGYRNYLWQTFRCELAHAGILDKWLIANSKSDFPVSTHYCGYADVDGFHKVDADYVSLPPNLIYKALQICINTYREEVKQKSANFEEECFEVETFKCSGCGKSFLGDTKDKCPFCDK